MEIRVLKTRCSSFKKHNEIRHNKCSKSKNERGSELNFLSTKNGNLITSDDNLDSIL